MYRNDMDPRILAHIISHAADVIGELAAGQKQAANPGPLDQAKCWRVAGQLYALADLFRAARLGDPGGDQ